VSHVLTQNQYETYMRICVT